MRTPEGKLVDDIRAKIEEVAARFSRLSGSLAFPSHKEEALRQLRLMNAQLESVRDRRGPAYQCGALLYTPEPYREGPVACIIAPTREILQRRLANFARHDAECDLEDGVKDVTALKALKKVYDVEYVKALY